MYKLTHISKSFAEKEVLKDINLILNNETVALIGENGAGKSTLLKIMLGEITPDDGIVETHGSVGYVPQHPTFGKHIQDCFDPKIEQWCIDIALQDVGLSKPMDFETANLSGGQKTRLSIAMVLVGSNQPGTLLLDEPTNNLDTKALSWLRTFVANYKGTIVIVSHDRSFINDTCSKVLEIKDGQLQIYSGNYDAYKQRKELEERHKLDVYNEQVEERLRLGRLLKSKSQQMASVSNEKYDKIKHEGRMAFHGKKNTSQKNTGKQIKALKTRIDQLEELERPEVAKAYSVFLSGNNHTGKLLVRFDGVYVDYLKNGKLPDIEIRGSQKIRVHGPNGSGKTTLLKIAAGLPIAYDGEAIRGTNVSLGYLSQDVDQLMRDATALANLESVSSDTTAIFREARALGLVNKDLKKKVSELSRGQQTKLSFAKLLLANHDILILDEPTNHVDIATKELIEQALRRYEGALLVSSHDEYFMRAIQPEITIVLGGNHA